MSIYVKLLRLFSVCFASICIGYCYIERHGQNRRSRPHQSSAPLPRCLAVAGEPRRKPVEEGGGEESFPSSTSSDLLVSADPMASDGMLGWAAAMSAWFLPPPSQLDFGKRQAVWTVAVRCRSCIPFGRTAVPAWRRVPPPLARDGDRSCLCHGWA